MDLGSITEMASRMADLQERVQAYRDEHGEDPRSETTSGFSTGSENRSRGSGGSISNGGSSSFVVRSFQKRAGSTPFHGRTHSLGQTCNRCHEAAETEKHALSTPDGPDRDGLLERSTLLHRECRGCTCKHGSKGTGNLPAVEAQ